MSLSAKSSLQSTRRKFFMNSTYIMSRVGIKRFWAQQAKMSLSAKSSLQSTRRKYFMNSTYTICRKYESKVFGLTRPK